jgi:hypothetical protein
MAFALVLIGLAALLLGLGPPQVPGVCLIAFVLGRAGLVQRDRDGLFWVFDFALAAGHPQLAVLVFVHDTLDRFFLTWRLVTGHKGTSQNQARVDAGRGRRFYEPDTLWMALVPFHRQKITGHSLRGNQVRV